MRIREPTRDYEPGRLEEHIRDFWSRTQAYRHLKAAQGQGDKFYLSGCPLPVTGNMHSGYIRDGVIQDAILRFRRSQGRRVLDTPGYGMHSLAVEPAVMKDLGIADTDGIREVGEERYARACSEHAGVMYDRMAGQMAAFGIWLDWEKPVRTSSPAYIESVWWSLREAHRKDLLRHADTVTAWCPRCRTPVSPMGIRYREREATTAYIKIPIRGRRDEYIVVWTTTPWTFAGALAVAVSADMTYARVAIREGGRKSVLIMLESQIDMLSTMENIDAFEVMDTLKGRELEGLEFFHPLMADIPYHKNIRGEWCHKIIAMDDIQDGGTGAVYLAPGMSHHDFLAGRDYDLPAFSPVDEAGKFTTEGGVKYAGQGTEQVSLAILSDLKAIRFLLHTTTEARTQGHCAGCGTPLIYRASQQWLLRAGDVRDIVLKTLKGVDWLPPGVMGEQAELAKGAVDWCVSRQGVWGVPMPVWECITDVCGHVEVVGSLKELKGSGAYKKDMDPHRPWIDSISLECPKCGGLMKRVEDVVDPWMDAGVVTWARLGYPRKKKPFKENWPSDMVTGERRDARFWLHHQAFTGIMLMGKLPFKRALVQGRLLDESGCLMELSDSEIADPNVLRKQHGADILRLHMLSVEPWKDMRLETDMLKHHRRVLNALWNTYVFAAGYMSMDKWDPGDVKASKIKKDLRPEDQWMLSRLESLTGAMRADMDAGMLHLACGKLEDFILDDLSRWYVRLVRERVWQGGDSPDKTAVFFTLREVLARLAVISSPFMPHMAEAIYQEMDGTMLSVSMTAWPEVDASRLAEGMEGAMSSIREIVRAANRLRQENGIPVRWPLRTLTISASGGIIGDAVDMFGHIIKRMVNVEKIDLVPENQEWAGQELMVIPNPNVIGKAYKQWESKIARMLKVLPARDVKAKIEAGEYTLGIEGQVIRILPEMVHFETKLPEGVISKEFDKGILYLDSNMDDELIARGFARHIIRRIQQMRKEMGLDPEEYIRLSMSMSQELLETLDPHLESMAEAVRSNEMEIVEEVEDDEEYVVEWPIEEENVVIGITSLGIKEAMDRFTCIPGVDGDMALSIVEAGITDGQAFLEAEREALLRIPGMSHSKLRKIKEFLEAPEDTRQTDTEQRCPLCDGVVEPGATECQRCGKNLVGGEDMDVEVLGGPEDEEETGEEYEVEEVRERVRVKRRRAPEPEELGPESDIIRMATGDMVKGKRSPEELIAAEILRDVAGREEAGDTMEPEQLEVPAITPPEEPMGPVVEIQGGLPGDAGTVAAPEEDAGTDAPESREPVAMKTEIIGTDRDRSIDAMAEVFGIKHSVAKALYNSGYDSIQALKKAKEDDLKSIKGIGKATARRIIQRLSGQETKMCSLCNAIVPADADTCPRCGVRFSEGAPAPREPEPAAPEVSEEQKAALRSLEKKFKKGPSDASLLYSKAMTLRDAGRRDEALRLVNEALELAPGDEKIVAARKELETEASVEVAAADTEAEAEIVRPETPGDGQEKEEKPEGTPEPPKAEIVRPEITPADPENATMQPETREDVAEGTGPGAGEGQGPAVRGAAVSGGVTVPDRGPEKREESPRGSGEIRLRESFTYLILEERSLRSYNLFKGCLDTGTVGYCVTRTYPEKVRERYNLGETPILWLSNVAKTDAVRPKDLEKLSLSLEEFLSHKGGVILLDGIEYLITNNNFITVLKLIQSLRDQVAINRSILLLSVNPSTMDSHQINLLKREVDSVID